MCLDVPAKLADHGAQGLCSGRFDRGIEQLEGFSVRGDLRIDVHSVRWRLRSEQLEQPCLGFALQPAGDIARLGIQILSSAS